MAAYRRVDGFKSPAGWLLVHRDQLRAQRSLTSMGELYLFYSTDIGLCAPNLGSFFFFRRWILPIADSQYTRKDFNAKYVKKVVVPCIMCRFWVTKSSVDFSLLRKMKQQKQNNDSVWCNMQTFSIIRKWISRYRRCNGQSFDTVSILYRQRRCKEQMECWNTHKITWN